MFVILSGFVVFFLGLTSLYLLTAISVFVILSGFVVFSLGLTSLYLLTAISVFVILSGFVVFFLGLTSLYLLTAISVDRYLVITRPLLGSKITHEVRDDRDSGVNGIAYLHKLFSTCIRSFLSFFSFFVSFCISFLLSKTMTITIKLQGPKIQT